MNSITHSSFITSNLLQYWCYNCSRSFAKIFIEGQALECPLCHSSMLEEVTKSSLSPPQSYIPFNSSIPQERIVLIERTNSYFEDLIEDLITLDYENDEIERIVNYLLLHDQNKYGSPPASKEVVKNLKEEAITKETILKFGRENIFSTVIPRMERIKRFKLTGITEKDRFDKRVLDLYERITAEFVRRIVVYGELEDK